MDYHIYLDGEKCGELTAAENARLRRDAKTDPRAWVAFVMAQVEGTGRVIALYLRLLGMVGGIGVLMAATFAPQVFQSAQGHSADEIALGIRTAAIYLSMVAALSVAGCLLFFPKMFGAANVFEDEFFRRVRLLKDIRRHGRLEVVGYAWPQSEGER